MINVSMQVLIDFEGNDDKISDANIDELAGMIPRTTIAFFILRPSK